MAKKILYLGNNKWCWTEECQLHAETIRNKQEYLDSVSTGNAKLIELTRSKLVATEAGLHTYRYLRVKELEKKIGRQLNLGLDLDGTTGDFTEALRNFMGVKKKISNELWMEHFPDPEEYAMWQGDKAWYTSKDDFLNHFQEAEASGVYRKLPIYESAHETLNLLKSYGFNIQVITARTPIYNHDTQHWIRKHRIPYSGIFNYGMEKEKAENIDVYVDDAPEVIKRLISNNKQIIVMNQLYNNHIETPEEKSKRIDKWGEEMVDAVFDLLDKKHNKDD